jgi:hypothetical protein
VKMAKEEELEEPEDHDLGKKSEENPESQP